MIPDENLDLHNDEQRQKWVNMFICKLFKYFKKIIDYVKSYINIVLGLKYCKIKWMKIAKKIGRKLMGVYYSEVLLLYVTWYVTV